VTVPDIEKIVSDYLRADPAVSAITTHILAKTPPKTDEPWVKVTMYGAPQLPGSRLDRLVPFALQVDCYAGYTGGKPLANDLARAARAAVKQMEGGIYGGAVISAVSIRDMPHSPDPNLKDDQGNERERYILDATVYAHS
jgi:hypothetical protein